MVLSFFFFKWMIYSIYVNDKCKLCAFCLEWKMVQTVIALRIAETLFHGLTDLFFLKGKVQVKVVLVKC